VGVAASDSNAAPALAIAATNGVVGARLIGNNNANTRSMAVPISMGTQMVALANSITNASDQSTFHLFTRHIKGDTAYALDNDVENTIYTVSNPNWVNSAGLQATGIAVALPAAADISNATSSAAGGGAPAANWTVLP